MKNGFNKLLFFTITYKMGGSITIGVLMPNDDVHYYVVDGGDISVHQIFLTKKEDHLKLIEHRCLSTDDYFSEEMFEEEDSSIRYLIIDDSNVVYRFYGCKEEYKLTKSKLK